MMLAKDVPGCQEGCQLVAVAYGCTARCRCERTERRCARCASSCTLAGASEALPLRVGLSWLRQPLASRTERSVAVTSEPASNDADFRMRASAPVMSADIPLGLIRSTVPLFKNAGGQG